MPAHVLQLVEAEVRPGEGPITLLGAAYKGNTDDARESPARELMQLALDRGYDVRVYDPHLVELPPFGDRLQPLELAVQDARAIILATDHSEFHDLDVGVIANSMKQRVLIDTRNWLDHSVWEAHGFRVVTLGVGRNPGEESREVFSLRVPQESLDSL